MVLKAAPRKRIVRTVFANSANNADDLVPRHLMRYPEQGTERWQVVPTRSHFTMGYDLASFQSLQILCRS